MSDDAILFDLLIGEKIKIDEKIILVDAACLTKTEKSALFRYAASENKRIVRWETKEEPSSCNGNTLQESEAKAKNDNRENNAWDDCDI